MDMAISSDPSPLDSMMGGEFVTIVTEPQGPDNIPVTEEKEFVSSPEPPPLDKPEVINVTNPNPVVEPDSNNNNTPPTLTPAPVAISNPVPTTAPRIVTRKRSSLSAPTTAPPPTECPNTTVEAPAKPPPKKKKKYTPKPKNPTAKPKKAPTPKPKKKSPKEPKAKKGKKNDPNEPVLPPPPLLTSEIVESENISPSDEQRPKPIRIKLQLPKLTKMPESLLTPVVAPQLNSAPDEDNDEDAADSNETNPTPVPGKQSRKKKSKGRNGNIYIGVFNRIEWMNLQNEFGFQSVNNFGTFVLQTMKRVHGDISFWCELAKASGVYPDLDKYVWTNGFPHAVNLNGENFTPPEVNLSEEKQEQVIKLGRSLWEQRLQQLQTQQQLSVESASGGGSATIPEEGEEYFDNDEEDAEDPGLENYLENMASNEGYSPGRNDGESSVVLEQDVNRIWEEQLKLSDAQNGKCFATLFNLVNSIEKPELDCENVPV